MHNTRELSAAAVTPSLPKLLLLTTASSLDSDHRSSSSSKMDYESGRCRRTDGRKWRCRRNVVPSQKYCEPHMHRGRQGSRKHVEHVTRVDTRMPDEIRLTVVTSSVDSRTNVSDKDNVDHSRRSNGTLALAVKSAEIKNSSVDNGGNCAAGKKLGFEDVNIVKTSKRQQGVMKNDNFGLVLPSFGLSPISVLHCSGGKVGLDLGLGGIRSITEAEQRRCRRTDGKKWQCRHDAILNQKYCEAHMHRGAKRTMLNPGCRTGSVQRATESAVARNRGSGINLNTIPESPECIYGNSSPNTSCDTTTITDDNISSSYPKC